jgi:hypothetical protein
LQTRRSWAIWRHLNDWKGVFMANHTPTNATDDADPERAAPNIWNTTPESQAPTFRNQNQVWPVRVIRRGDAVRPLHRTPFARGPDL